MKKHIQIFAFACFLGQVCNFRIKYWFNLNISIRLGGNIAFLLVYLVIPLSKLPFLLPASSCDTLR